MQCDTIYRCTRRSDFTLHRRRTISIRINVLLPMRPTRNITVVLPAARETLRRGEVTPIYMYWRPSMQRIWQYNPNIRLIALLRNPVERAYSHWNMEKTRGLETLPFLAALREERARLRAARPLQDRVHSYVDRGFYSEQIRRMWSYFDERQTLFIRSDLLASEPRSQLRRVCEFLDIEDVYQHIDATRVFEGTYSAPIETEALDLLNHVFDGELRSIEQMLSWDLASWRPQRAQLDRWGTGVARGERRGVG